MTTPKSFPDWETLYRQQPGETLPWYYADLDPDLEAALREHGLAGGRLLDLGTGPGTQAIALAARGFEVTGSDLSATAVARATALARARGVQVSFVEDDVLASRLTGRFDLSCSWPPVSDPVPASPPMVELRAALACEGDRLS
jgi:methylase of polypeptide subunit release factors